MVLCDSKSKRSVEVQTFPPFSSAKGIRPGEEHDSCMLDMSVVLSAIDEYTKNEKR